jgi:assimilatory nitrate reductase catalytic subunit
MDGVLFCGLLIHLADGGFIDHAFVGAHAEGFEAALAAARQIAPDLAAVAKKSGAASADIAALFALWAPTNRVATLYSQSVNNPGKAEAVGARLNAGTNCGSCLPELRRMIAARAQDMAHAVLPA